MSIDEAIKHCEEVMVENLEKTKDRIGECAKRECPFYYTTEYKPAREITEHCHKAESEG